jgi:membrane associated rhomboid family serine protease
LRRAGAAVLPLVAGAILLGWFGAGGGDPNIDVPAHVFGFGAGLIFGFLAAAIRHLRAVPAVVAR